MADTVAHIVYLSNKDSGNDTPVPPSTDYLLIEPTPIGFIPAATGNTQYLNRLVIAPNGFLYAIDVAGNAVQFSGVTANVYQNGITKTGLNVDLGGALLKATTVALSGYALNFSGAGNVTIGGTGGTEKLTVKGGNILVDDNDGEIILRDAGGDAWGTHVTEDGVLIHESGSETRRSITSIREATESVLLSIPFGDRVARQFYYATDLDMYLYVRDDKSYEYVNRTYTHNQLAPASTWSIAHNMRRFPSVTVVDSAGTVMYGEVQYTDQNNIVVIFASATAGKAHLN